MTGSARQSRASKPDWIASSLTLLAMTKMRGAGKNRSPRPEDRRADAHMGGAELDRDREVGAHAHRQFRKTVARGDLRGQREMRRRRIANRRNAHQAGNRQAIFFAAAGNEG